MAEVAAGSKAGPVKQGDGQVWVPMLELARYPGGLQEGSLESEERWCCQPSLPGLLPSWRTLANPDVFGHFLSHPHPSHHFCHTYSPHTISCHTYSPPQLLPVMPTLCTACTLGPESPPPPPPSPLQTVFSKDGQHHISHHACSPCDVTPTLLPWSGPCWGPLLWTWVVLCNCLTGADGSASATSKARS